VQYVYILRCADGSYYVGVADSLGDRVRRQNDGRGAAYTRRRRPVTLVYAEPHLDLASAICRERQLKRWSRRRKEALIRRGLRLGRGPD
jgi:predicted GIY-YIG superfamily endonuclease